MARSTLNQRRGQWSPGSFQIRVLLTTFSLTAIVLGFGIFSSLRGLLDLQTRIGTVSAPFLEMLTQEFVTQTLVAGVATVLLSLSAALAYFGFAGPIHAVRQYFRKLSVGRWDAHCQIRENDSLHDLKDSVNETLDGMRSLLRGQHDVLAKARELLDEACSDDERVNELTDRMSAVAAEYERRLGNPNATRQEIEESAARLTGEMTS